MIIITEDAPLPNDAQLSWRSALESRLWSTLLLLLVCHWWVDCFAAGFDPPPPMVRQKDSDGWSLASPDSGRRLLRPTCARRKELARQGPGTNWTTVGVEMSVEEGAHNPQAQEKEEAQVVVLFLDHYLHLCQK